MTIFLSYAHEQAAIAESIAMHLLAAGHDVFFDRRSASLAPGTTYDEEIARNIEDRELFVFLISPDSVKPGYALTELKIRSERHPNPATGLLPVVVEALGPDDKAPEYLRPVTFLTPVGDLTAEVVYAVWKRRGQASAAGAAASDAARTLSGPPIAIAADTVSAYRRLWALTDVLPRWPKRDDATYEDLGGLSERLRAWYFTDGGGMFLSREAHGAYSELQEGLTAMVSGHAGGALTDEHYEHIRLLCSALRSRLAAAIGAR